MFNDLIQALKSQNLEPGQSISLSKLCKATGICPFKWSERLNSTGIKMMILEDIEPEGFTVKTKLYGRKRGHVFERVG